MKKQIQSETHETVDWEHKPINALGGLRAIAVTTGGTTIDGLLEYHVEGTVDGVYVESLNFRNLPQYVIVSGKGGSNMLSKTLFKSITVFAS